MIRKITPLLLSLLIAFGIRSSAQSSCPPNIDFEMGSFLHWSCFTGLFTGGSTLVVPSPCPPTNGRHNIMTGAGTDYYGGFPIVSPGGGSFSARIGYDTNAQKSERIRYYVPIPTGAVDFALVYRYAIVLELPPSGHSTTQEPRFDVTATDSATGASIPCAAYNYVSSVGLPGFTTSPITSRAGNGLDVLVRDWNTATLNLTGLGGTTVAIDFAVADCSLGGHFGYAYVDMSCGLFEVQGLTCNDTSTHVTLSAPAGFEFYHWYDSATFTILYGTTQTVSVPVPTGPFTYAVILTPYSGFGCPDTLYTHISPTNLQTHPMHDTMLCNGDSVVLNSGATDVALPLSYSWSGAGLSCTTCANPVAHPPAGTTIYSVTVTNIAGCTRDTFITITVDPIAGSITKFDDTCHLGTTGWARITMTGGQPPFSYLWSTTPPQTTATASGLSGAGPGTYPTAHITYSVLATDALGCRLPESVDIYDGRPTDLYVISSKNPDSCDVPNGYIVLDSLLPGQTFTIAYDSNGVSRMQVRTANANWQDTLVRLGKGTYSNIRIITSHCPYNIVGPVTLIDPPRPAVPALGSNSPICVGSALTLSALSNPGVLYQWYDPNGGSSTSQNRTLNPSTFSDSGVYRVIVNQNMCFDSNKIRIKINPIPIPSANNNSAICSGDTLKLHAASANGASYFVWNGPNGFYANSSDPYVANAPAAASGTYSVTAVLNGCLDTTSTFVIVNQTPGAPGVQDTELCQNGPEGPMIAFPDPGNSLNWYTQKAGGAPSTVAPTPPNQKEGIDSFYVSQVSPAGCESPRSLIKAQIDYLASPVLQISDSTICRQGDVQFFAAATGDDLTGITWDFGDGHSYTNENPMIHSFTGVGQFTVTATALYKVCPTETVTRVVRVHPSPSLYLGSDTTICPGSNALILSDNTNAGIPGTSWKWSTGETSSFIRVTAPGTYYVKVSMDGCFASDTIVVAKDCFLDIPNVFTPNGDGMNDFFFPRQLLAKGLTSFSMSIFNRWGQEIFSSTSLEGRGWDGRFNDMPQPEGVYVYIIDVTFKDGQKEHHQGNITLLR